MMNIDIFPWDDNFDTGIEVVDMQHRKLVQLLNRLATLVAYQSTKEELNAIFDELTEYTLYHFETEESIWHKYLDVDPLFDEHQVVHQSFVDTVQRLKNGQDLKPLSELADEALGFLARWLASHILEGDRHMAYVVKALQKGMDMKAAKVAAKEGMGGSHRVLIEIILSIYSTLSTNTLNLMRELQSHTSYQNKITYQDHYRELLIELATSFINLPLDEIDTAIQGALGKMATFIGADRAYIFDYDFDAQTTSNTYEWCADGITPQKEALQNLPLEIVADWIEIHTKGEHFFVEDVFALPQGELRDTLMMQDIQSLVTFPLMKKNKCIGMVGFDAVTQKHTFATEEIALLKLFSALLANVAEKKLLEISKNEALLTLKKAETMAKIGNWTLDLSTGKLDWSDEVFNIFELDKDHFEPSYETFLDTTHPEDREIIHTKYTHSLITKEKYTLTHRLLMRDGRIKYVTEQCENSFDEEGKPLYSMGTVQDITERWHLEEAQRIAATVFESKDGMIVTDSDAIILKVNQAFTEITGYSANEAIGRTPSFLESSRNEKPFFTTMWQSILDKGVWENEILSRRKNGEVYPQYFRITAVRDDYGRISNLVATLNDITFIKEASKEIKNLAFYDPLTKLPNRRLLMDRLNHRLTANIQEGQQGALLFMDLDHFKTLNDTLGHNIGDMLLECVAKRLTSCIRKGDTAARIGGDEFVVLLEVLNKESIVAATQTEHIAEKIHHALNQPYQLGKHTYTITPSIGVILFSGHEQQNADELLKQADIAMYEAKAQGRNTIRFFDPKMQEVIAEREMMKQSLQRAIAEDEFELYYQTQVGDDAQILGVEALIRWHHSERGMILPQDFIPLAEDTGLILPIGQWVLERACAQLQSWQNNASTKELTISINVSTKQFSQSGFVEQVLTTVRKYAINPRCLKMELTESMLVENIDDIIIKMRALSDEGISFSLDDFGTGYSSLQYLKLLPIDQLKIDQSFVRDINHDKNDSAIVVTIINVTQGLEIDVIAEGVETEEQRQFLLDHGCTHYQGYLFGKPMPVEMFEGLLKSSVCP